MFITNLKQVVVNLLNREEEVLSPVTKSELHGEMHSLIQRHKELVARIKENHELIQQMKQTVGMARQKHYVWQEIQADRELATDLAEDIKSLKARIYGEKATNMGARL